MDTLQRKFKRNCNHNLPQMSTPGTDFQKKNPKRRNVFSFKDSVYLALFAFKVFKRSDRFKKRLFSNCKDSKWNTFYKKLSY